jgi:hypothetical protein
MPQRRIRHRGGNANRAHNGWKYPDVRTVHSRERVSGAIGSILSVATHPNFGAAAAPIAAIRHVFPKARVTN